MVLCKNPSCTDTLLPFDVGMFCLLTSLHVFLSTEISFDLGFSESLKPVFPGTQLYVSQRPNRPVSVGRCTTGRRKAPLPLSGGVQAWVETGFPYFPREQIGCRPHHYHNSLLLKDDSFMEALLPPSCWHSPWLLRIRPSITYFFQNKLGDDFMVNCLIS